MTTQHLELELQQLEDRMESFRDDLKAAMERLAGIARLHHEMSKLNRKAIITLTEAVEIVQQQVQHLDVRLTDVEGK